MATLYEQFEPAIQAPFERGPYGTAWGAAFGNVKDLHLQRMKQGVLSRFPTFAAPDAIGQIALERQMVQGINESLAHFVQRLLNPWGVWTEGGTYWGLLAELSAAGYDGIDGHGSVYIAASNGYIYGPGDNVKVPDPVNPYDPGSTYLIPEDSKAVVHVNGVDLNGGRARKGPVWTKAGAVPFVYGDSPIGSVGPFLDGPVDVLDSTSAAQGCFEMPIVNPLNFQAGQSWCVTVLFSAPDMNVAGPFGTDGYVLLSTTSSTDSLGWWLTFSEPGLQFAIFNPSASGPNAEDSGSYGDGVGAAIVTGGTGTVWTFPNTNVDLANGGNGSTGPGQFVNFNSGTVFPPPTPYKLNVVSIGYDAATQGMLIKVNGAPIATGTLGADNQPTTSSITTMGAYDPGENGHPPFGAYPLAGQLFEVLASTNVPSDAAFTAIYEAVQANIRAIPGTPPGFTRIPPWYSFGSAPASQQWAAHTNYAVNDIVIPIVETGYFYISTQGGESGAIEPAFPGPSGSVTDGTVTWTYGGGYTRVPFYPPWNFGGANGQGAPSTLTSYSGTDAIGPGGDASPDGAFWSRFVVIFDPMPSSWSSIANPPTTSSSPGSAEISVIREIIAKLKPAKSTCVGIVALPGDYTRACWGWPLTTTPNIPVSCWLSRAISSGDVDAIGDFAAQVPQTVESWLAHTTFTTSGRPFVYMIPSSAWENDHSPTLMLFEATGPAVTTGFVEPNWPTVIGDTVSDGLITWTAIATLYRWQDQTGVTVFTL